MTAIALGLKSLRSRRFTVGLTVASVALSTMLLLGVERLRHQVREGFTNTISGVDLVVGPRSGSVSLLLSSVFRIGNPLQTMEWASYERLSARPDVAWVIPLSVGDSLGRYKVVGTTQAYFVHYRYGQSRLLAFSEGRPFSDQHDAVLGAEVARALGYSVGDQIVLDHGTGEGSFVSHDDVPFTVSGVLKVTGTPVDQAVHITLKGMDALHQDFHGGQHDHHGHDHDHDPLMDALRKASSSERSALSACLVGMKNRADSLSLQREVNERSSEPLSAILPGVALQELWGMMSIMERVLLIIGGFVLIVTLTGMFVALLTGLNERRREMAILRSVGARPADIVRLLVIEAGVVTLAGVVIGCAGLYCLLAMTGPVIQDHFGVHLPTGLPRSSEWVLMAVIVFGGLVVGFVPGVKSARQALSDGLKSRS